LRYTGIVKNVAFVGALVAFVVVLGLVIARVAGLDADAKDKADTTEQTPDAALSQRLAIAYGALRDAEGARRLPEAHRYATAAIDAIAGPAGRHARPNTPPGGILPEDAEQISTEPGLALRAYDAAPAGSPLRAAVAERITGDVDAWRTPRDRYDAIDRAVADYRPDNDTVGTLPGDAARALAWALLTLKTENINDAHELAGRAAASIRQSLDAVRTARATQ
jgi:hypothetical protein